MDANTINQQATTLGEYIFNIVSWVNLGVGFFLGIVASYYGNRIWEWRKKKKRGTQTYCEVSTTGNIISVEAQVPNTAANLTVVSKLTKATVPEDP
jgi:putative flippase GtrA